MAETMIQVTCRQQDAQMNGSPALMVTLPPHDWLGKQLHFSPQSSVDVYLIANVETHPESNIDKQGDALKSVGNNNCEESNARNLILLVPTNSNFMKLPTNEL